MIIKMSKREFTISILSRPLRLVLEEETLGFQKTVYKNGKSLGIEVDGVYRYLGRIYYYNGDRTRKRGFYMEMNDLN